MRWLCLALALLAAPAQGAVLVGFGAAPPAGDSCTGGLLFSWHMENATVGAGSDTGCSLGDTTATYNSLGALSNTQAYDGTQSVTLPTSADQAYFAVSGEDIAKGEAGRLDLWYYPNAIGATSHIASVYVDATHYIDVFQNSVNAIRMNYNNAGAVNCTTTDTVAAGAWYHIVASWSVAGVGGKYMRVGLNQADSLPTMVECNTSLTDVGAPTSLVVGDPVAGGANGYVDKLKVYDAW